MLIKEVKTCDQGNQWFHYQHLNMESMSSRRISLKRQFSQKESEEMYNIIVEIHESLTDKSESKGGVLKLGQYEIGWLIGIDELLKKINERVA